MRVLHAPVSALYQPYLYSRAVKAAGFESDFMTFNAGDDSWLMKGYDYDLQLDGRGGLQVEKSKEINFFKLALKEYDIFHFHSGRGLLNNSYSLWEELSEIEVLKAQGKKILMSWWGCDIRTEAVDISNKWSACNECETSIRGACALENKKTKINRALNSIDVHLSSGDLVASFPELKWMDIAIDTDDMRPMELEQIPREFRLSKDPDEVLIYHSFGNSEIRGDVKGTKYIKSAVEKLNAEGYRLKFMFFDRIENKYIKYYQAQADIVIDQLLCGWYGSTGAECLSLGKPVITYIRPEVKNVVRRDHPLIDANPENIYVVLKSLLDGELGSLEEIGRRSRDYAEKYHDYRKVGNELVKLYESL